MNGLGNHFGLNVADVDLNSDYRDLLIALADAGADFLLIGGWALALHGYGRGTDLVGRRIPYIGRTMLLKNKRAAGRAKDLADIEWFINHPSDT